MTMMMHWLMEWVRQDGSEGVKLTPPQTGSLLLDK